MDTEVGVKGGFGVDGTDITLNWLIIVRLGLRAKLGSNIGNFSSGLSFSNSVSSILIPF